MKKSLITLLFIAFAAFSVIIFSGNSLKVRADDGDIPTGGRTCTPTPEVPCPEIPPQNRSNSQSTGENDGTNDESSDDGDDTDWLNFWLNYYLFG